MGKTKKAKNIEIKKVTAFYMALFQSSHVHGVRENVMRELIKTNHELTEFKPKKIEGKITINEDQLVYIQNLLRQKEINTKLAVLSKVLLYEEK